MPYIKKIVSPILGSWSPLYRGFYLHNISCVLRFSKISYVLRSFQISCVLRFVKITCALDQTRLETATKIFCGWFWLFPQNFGFFLVFRPFFFEMLFLLLHPLVFPRPKQCQTLQKHPFFSTQFRSTHLFMLRSANFGTTHVFPAFSGGSSMMRLQRTKKASQPAKHPQTARKADLRNRTLGGARQLRGPLPLRTPLVRSSGRAATSG